MTDRRRLSFTLNDIQYLTPGEYVPGELLIDGLTKELVLIDDDGTPIRSITSIENKLKNYLKTDHATDLNAHGCATEKECGFMSSEDKVKLTEVLSFIDELKDIDIVDQSIFDRRIYDGIISEPKYKIGDNMTLEISNFSLILNKKFVDVPPLKISIPHRPDNDFINIDGEAGFRHDMVYLSIIDGDFSLNIIEDYPFSEKYKNSIEMNGIKYYKDNTNECIYNGVNGSIVLLYMATVYNNQIRDVNNPYGYVNDQVYSENDIITVYHKIFNNLLVPEIILNDTLRLYKEKKLSNNNIINYSKITNYGLPVNNGINIIDIPLNGTDMETVSGANLHKMGSFNRGLNKFKLFKANKEGSYINIANKLRDSFTIDFIIEELDDNDDIIMKFLNKLYDETITLSRHDDILSLKVEDKDILNIPLFKDIYNFIKILYNGTSFIVDVNGKTSYKAVRIINLKTIEHFQLSTMNTSISNVSVKNHISMVKAFNNNIDNFIFNKLPIENIISSNEVKVSNNMVIPLNITRSERYECRRMNPDKWSKHDQIVMIKKIGEYITGPMDGIPVLSHNNTNINIKFVQTNTHEAIITIVDDIEIVGDLILSFNSVFEKENSDLVPKKNVKSIMVNSQILQEIKSEYVDTELIRVYSNKNLISKYSYAKPLVFTSKDSNVIQFEIDIDSILAKNGISIVFRDLLEKVTVSGLISSSDDVTIQQLGEESNLIITNNKNLDKFSLECKTVDRVLKIRVYINDESISNYIAINQLAVTLHMSSEEDSRLFINNGAESLLLEYTDDKIEIHTVTPNTIVKFISVVSNIVDNNGIVGKYDSILSRQANIDDKLVYLVSNKNRIQFAEENEDGVVKIFDLPSNPLLLGVDN